MKLKQLFEQDNSPTKEELDKYLFATVNWYFREEYSPVIILDVPSTISDEEFQKLVSMSFPSVVRINKGNDISQAIRRSCF